MCTVHCKWLCGCVWVGVGGCGCGCVIDSQGNHFHQMSIMWYGWSRASNLGNCGQSNLKAGGGAKNFMHYMHWSSCWIRFMATANHRLYKVLYIISLSTLIYNKYKHDRSCSVYTAYYVGVDVCGCGWCFSLLDGMWLRLIDSLPPHSIVNAAFLTECGQNDDKFLELTMWLLILLKQVGDNCWLVVGICICIACH